MVSNANVCASDGFALKRLALRSLNALWRAQIVPFIVGLSPNANAGYPKVRTIRIPDYCSRKTPRVYLCTLLRSIARELLGRRGNFMFVEGGMTRGRRATQDYRFQVCAPFRILFRFYIFRRGNPGRKPRALWLRCYPPFGLSCDVRRFESSRP